MDRVASGGLGRGHDLFGVQIRCGADAAQRVRLIGLCGMERPDVVLGKNRHRPDTHLGGGANDPNRDLAAICDQQTLRNHATTTFSSSPSRREALNGRLTP